MDNPKKDQKYRHKEKEVKTTDFDCFKVMEEKKLMNRIIKNEVKKHQKAAMPEASPGHLPLPETKKKCQLPNGDSNSWL